MCVRTCKVAASDPGVTLVSMTVPSSSCASVSPKPPPMLRPQAICQRRPLGNQAVVVRGVLVCLLVVLQLQPQRLRGRPAVRELRGQRTGLHVAVRDRRHELHHREVQVLVVPGRVGLGGVVATGRADLVPVQQLPVGERVESLAVIQRNLRNLPGKSHCGRRVARELPNVRARSYPTRRVGESRASMQGPSSRSHDELPFFGQGPLLHLLPGGGAGGGVWPASGRDGAGALAPPPPPPSVETSTSAMSTAAQPSGTRDLLISPSRQLDPLAPWLCVGTPGSIGASRPRGSACGILTARVATAVTMHS